MRLSSTSKKYAVLLGMVLVSAVPNAFAYGTLNGKIVDGSGNTVNIDGVNWAGFQDSGFIDELYGAIPFYPLGTTVPFGVADMLTHPWDNAKTGVTKDSSVSFKTIRLPMQPGNLRDNTVNSHFRYDLTDAKNRSQGNGVFCSAWDAQHCTAGISTRESLFAVIREFKNSNIRVLVDFHQTPVGRNGNVVESNYSLASYAADVKEVATQVKTRSLTNVIGIDVFNEPHNLAWFRAAGNQPAWAAVIQAAGLAVYQANPDLLLFVEGPASAPRSDLHICVPQSGPSTPPQEPAAYTMTANTAACGSGKYEVAFKANWGEMFGDLLNTAEAAKGNAVFDAAAFRSAVCGNNTAFCIWLLGNAAQGAQGHLVFSPHIYGQFVATWQSSPKASPYRFDWNWGFLIRAGFPVVIGESGYLPDKAADVSFFADSVTPYLIAKNIPHNLFYWTWNTNSGDTGGVRQDANTVQLVASKEASLAKLYNTGAVPAKTGTLKLTAGTGSDTRCATAADSLYLDGSTASTDFTPATGFSKIVSIGSHSLRLASASSPIGVTGGSCTGKLGAGSVTVAENQTAAVTAVWSFSSTPPIPPSDKSCRVTSATVVQQSDWGSQKVNQFSLSVTLTGFEGEGNKISLDGTFVMKNPLVQNFWSNFDMQPVWTAGSATAKFTGTLWTGNQITLGGFISNATPLVIGGNPLVSITLNGVVCQ